MSRMMLSVHSKRLRHGLATCLLLILAPALAQSDVGQAERKIYAQRLVRETLAQHPEVAHIVMHVTPPNRPDSDNRIIASNIGRIGKLADDDDLRIMRTGAIEAVVSKTGDRFNVSLPFVDAAGKAIGVVAIGFPYKPGTDTAALQKRAAQLRDELKTHIPNVEKLFAAE